MKVIWLVIQFTNDVIKKKKTGILYLLFIIFLWHTCIISQGFTEKKNKYDVYIWRKRFIWLRDYGSWRVRNLQSGCPSLSPKPRSCSGIRESQCPRLKTIRKRSFLLFTVSLLSSSGLQSTEEVHLPFKGQYVSLIY